MTHILVIEDNPDIQELIREFLMAQNFTVDVVGAGTEGILLFQKKFIRSCPPRCNVTRYRWL